MCLGLYVFLPDSDGGRDKELKQNGIKKNGVIKDRGVVTGNGLIELIEKKVD